MGFMVYDFDMQLSTPTISRPSEKVRSATEGLSCPKLLYRYSPTTHLAKILKGEVSFAAPCELNDPFDTWPNLPDDSKLLCASIKEAAEKGKYGNIPQEFINSASVDNRSNAERAQDVWDAINKKCRVLCFSESSEVPLLWWHYADGGKGICVGYATAPLQEAFGAFHKVEYVKNKPIYTVGDTRQLIMKGIAWDYEKEWRLIRRSEIASGNRFNASCPVSIKRIILGSRCKETFDTIRLQAELTGTVVERLVVNSSSFAFTFDVLGTL